MNDLLLYREYRPKVIKAAIDKARGLDRREALKKVQKHEDENDRVRFITTYDPRLNNVIRILKENHKVMLESDGRLNGHFPNHPWYASKGHPTSKTFCAEPNFHPRGLTI